ncbi:MAG: LysR family positive regulator for ilvC [Granulosicoccus sp.]|jgi:LysR family positive regulator for ilvC
MPFRFSMNYKSLHHFQTLAQTLHFGRASEAANISISAMSRNIRQLEEDVGVALFTRDNRSVVLTPEGAKFEIYARNALIAWTQIRRELTDSSDTLQGEISLYCSVTASYSILFDLLEQFRPKFPGIDIKLHTGDPEHAISQVLSGDDEICIAAYPASLQKTLKFKPITKSPLLFIAPVNPVDERIPMSPPTDAALWSEVPMILAQGGVARTRVDQWFRSLKVSPRIYAQVAGNEAIVSMVSLGLGVGVVPKIVLDNSPLAERVRVLPVKPDLQPYDLGLITSKKNLKNALVRAFWSIVESSPNN